MSTTITTHSTMPSSDSGSAPPPWLHLAPLGKVTGIDGRGPYLIGSAVEAQAIIEASKKHMVPVDENHSTEHAKVTGIPSPARGWVVEMEARADGIYGRIEWTPDGTALMSQRAYRGVSPAWRVDPKTGRVLSIVSVGLTNTPNIAEIHTHAQQDEEDMELVALRARLGLAADANEAAVMAAIDAKDAAIATHSQTLGTIAAAAMVNAKDVPELVTALQSQRTQMVPVTAMIELQSRFDGLKAETTKARAVAFVDAAIKEGKPIAAEALRTAMIEMHSANPTQAEAMVNAMVSINAGGSQVEAQASGGGAADELTADEKAVADKFGQSHKEYAANKAKMKGASR